MYIDNIFKFNYFELNDIYILKFYFEIELNKIIFFIIKGFFIVNIFGDIFIDLIEAALINVVCNKFFEYFLIFWVRGI